jgi:AraC-like DNA-binding protein
MKVPTLQERTKFWQAQDLGELDLLHATYITHTFSRHIHEGYAIGVIERGAETFYYRGGMHTAPAGSIVVINPGEVHTGQAVNEKGWTYRMLYPEVPLVQKAALQISERWQGIPDFPQPVIWDQYLVRLIGHLHVVLETSTDPLEREAHFISTLAQFVARHAEGHYPSELMAEAHRAIERAREFLEAHYAENISLDQLASLANLSPFHFVRLFRKATGLPPHAYLTQIRIEKAKALLFQGWPIARVAAEVGFVDQSHFTRRFKSIVGVTPGQYAYPAQKCTRQTRLSRLN